MRAYCFASGHIEFSAKVPDGALPIASGSNKELRDFISGVARHGYDGETLLVPGVPEAQDQMKAVEALQLFLAWIGENPPKNVVVSGGWQKRK